MSDRLEQKLMEELKTLIQEDKHLCDAIESGRWISEEAYIQSWIRFTKSAFTSEQLIEFAQLQYRLLTTWTQEKSHER